MKIVEFSQFDGELADNIRSMTSQLSSAACSPSNDVIRGIASGSNSHLLLAVENGRAIGMLTLIIYSIPTGMKAVIEDVVVEVRHRKKRVGEHLLRRAIDIGMEHEVRKIDLTSQGARIAANRLYQKIGFEQRSTNVYRYTISGKDLGSIVS